MYLCLGVKQDVISTTMVLLEYYINVVLTRNAVYGAGSFVESNRKTLMQELSDLTSRMEICTIPASFWATSIPNYGDLRTCTVKLLLISYFSFTCN